MRKKIDLIMFRENNKEKTLVRDCAFMNCPHCGEELLLQTDKVTFCRKDKCKYLNRVVYKLRKNTKTPEGFDKVLAVEVEDFKKTTIWEAFKNE